MIKKTVYVAGYPKSGTTYLTRLLGETFDCPTGGSIKAQDKKEPAAGGFDRPNPYMIRKGHFIIDNIYRTRAVVKPHVMNPEMLRSNEFVLQIFRDPRDIAVSMSYYWRVTVKEALNQMYLGEGHCRFCGNWASYVSGWIEIIKRNGQAGFCTYENLIRDPESILRMAGRFAGLPLSVTKMRAAIKNNQIGETIKRIERTGDSLPLGKELNLRLVRKGISGDWRNHLDRISNGLAWSYFGDVMTCLGCEREF